MEKAIMTSPTPYPDLNDVLRELVEGVQAVLGADLVSVCLQGSFAVGDFDPHSDVDFIIAVEQELAGDQVIALQAMHKRIYNLDCEWAKHLEGSYFPKDVLRSYSQRGKPLWYLDNGSRSLVQSEHDNTIVVRWVVREHGVALAGPDPATLVDPTPVGALRQEIVESMNRWWQQVQANPESINNRFYQTFAVLHYCRLLHDLHTGFPGSKRAGVEWAKANLDPSWTGLIDRTWDGRPNPAVSVRQPADPQDLKRTLEFIPYTIKIGEEMAASLGIGREQPVARSVVLRDVIQADLPIFFEHQLDSDANHMAAFTAKNPADREAFTAHWAKILGDATITIKTILFEGQVAGHVLCHAWFGDPEVSYWIGKEYWGRGIATRALALFLGDLRVRPLYARAAQDNAASIRVLRKCGFTISGEGKGVSNARGQEVQEYILKLQ